MRKPVRAYLGDERIAVPDEPRSSERVWIHELADYLNVKTGRLRKHARAWGGLHRTSSYKGAHARQSAKWWVSPRCAMRLIALIRCEQAQEKKNDPVYKALKVRIDNRFKRALRVDK